MITTSPDTVGGEPIAWGREWIHLLQKSGEGYQARLPSGRSLARKGAVREIDLLPGHITARVVGTHGEIHQVDIAVKVLSASEWEQIADVIGAHASNLAALLDGTLQPGLLRELLELEIHLLPGPSDLRPDCSCEDWSEPCQHAAAACFAVAEAIDRDPFNLFLLRGTPRSDLISLVRSRRSGSPDGHESDNGSHISGTPAAAVWAGRSVADDLLQPPPQPSEGETALRARGPGTSARWQVDIPPRFGIVPGRVDSLAADAVIRAWRMVEFGDDSMLRLDARSDLARRAAMADWPSAVSDLASLGGVTTHHLSAWITAWRVAGPDGVLAVADRNSWVKDPDLLAEGREQLVSMGMDRRSIALNYDSIGLGNGVILVLTISGLWYRLSGGGYQDLALSREPSRDIAELVDLT